MKKNIVMVMLAVVSLLVTASCKKNVPEAPVQLPVTFYNTSGMWKLQQWNGSDVDFNLTIELKDKKFKMTQDVGSMYPVTYTGSYNLITLEDDSVIIRGMYDHTSEFWDSEYVIASLTAAHMLWVDKDQSGKSQLFIKIPDNQAL